MSEDLKEETKGVVKYVTYQFEVNQLGLMNAPSTIQRIMDKLFRDFPLVRTYLDDDVSLSSK